MLDASMEELFVTHMEGARYLDKEGKSLTELYAAKLIRFTNWHVRRSLCLAVSPPCPQETDAELDRAARDEQGQAEQHDL